MSKPPALPNEQALEAYLHDLLFDEPKPTAPTSLPATLLPADFLVPKEAREELVDHVLDSDVASGHAVADQIDVDARQDERVEIVESTAPISVTESYGDEALEWLDNGRPRWAQNEFDVLLFRAGGFTMAVPLISLGHIQQLDDKLSPIFGQAPWLMGLLPSAEGQIRVVNTPLYVMPERYQRPGEHRPPYAITLQGLQWGLAVDEVNQPIRLKPEAVKWRQQRIKQPWLAGVIGEHMCVLLDLPRLGRLLLDSEGQSRVASRQSPDKS